ncbi:MAG TPA: tetratricopeptide repeat protein [Candidatus Binatia bacterium]|nr:tetratricopeptide repeat protein [Candidatus Binatia bacterium]
MNRKGLCLLCLFLCVLLDGVAPAADRDGFQPLTLTQLMAWQGAGVPQARLVRLIHERGLARAAGPAEIRQFEEAGAEPELLGVIGSVPSGQAGKGEEIPATLFQAAMEAKGQHFHEAELAVRRALRDDPENAALHFVLGTMLRQQELWDDAFEEIGKSARLMPDFPENHSAFAYIFYRLDDGPNAIAEARTALSMDPQNAEGYQFLALGLYANEQYGAAEHAFAESLARDPANSDTYYDLGIAFHADKNPDAAITAYREAIRLNANFWQAHSNMALIFHEENRLDEALSEYREARRLAPDEPSVRNNLANTYCDKGQFDSALAELRELYREHPEWEQGHACMARAYMSKKDYGNAVGELELAVRQDPANPGGHRALGEALLLDEKIEEAVHELRAAVSLDPDSEAAHHALGTALFQQQQLPAAEKEFREALRLRASPDNHYSLAACLMSMSRYEEALAELETAARMDPERQLYRARHDELLRLMQNQLMQNQPTQAQERETMSR